MNTFNTNSYHHFDHEESELDNHWIIDRTPDFNNRIIIDLNEDLNEDVNEIFNEETNVNRLPSFNNIIQVGELLYIPNSMYHSDDFIPFINERKHSNYIDVKVEIFNVLEEDRNCCICMEKRGFQEICLLNCLHKFCSECTITHIRRNTIQSCCPLCRKCIRNISVQTEDIHKIFI